MKTLIGFIAKFIGVNEEVDSFVDLIYYFTKEHRGNEGTDKLSFLEKYGRTIASIFLIILIILISILK